MVLPAESDRNEFHYDLPVAEDRFHTFHKPLLLRRLVGAFQRERRESDPGYGICPDMLVYTIFLLQERRIPESIVSPAVLREGSAELHGRA